jgi:hypothetical protein
MMAAGRRAGVDDEPLLPSAEVAMLEAAKEESLSMAEHLEEAALEQAVALSRLEAQLANFRAARARELSTSVALAKRRRQREQARKSSVRPPEEEGKQEEASVAAVAAAAGHAAADARALILTMPTGILRQILLHGTTHHNLVIHLARCAQVHPDWRRLVLESPAYLGGSVLSKTAWAMPAHTRSNGMPVCRPRSDGWCFGLFLSGRAAVLQTIERALRGSTEALRIFVRHGVARIRVDGLCDDGAAVLGASLAAMGTPTPVTELDLRNCELSTAGIHSIATMLRQSVSGGGAGGGTDCCRIKVLKMRPKPGLRFGDADLAAIATALPPMLAELDMEAGATADGVSALARALQANWFSSKPMAALRKMSFWSNRPGQIAIEGRGACEFAQALSTLSAARPSYMPELSARTIGPGYLHLSLDKLSQRNVIAELHVKNVSTLRWRWC